MTPDTIALIDPFDAHLHARQGDMLRNVLPHSSRTFATGLLMPNIVPPVVDLALLNAYRQSVLDERQHHFNPLFTLYFTTRLTRDVLRQCYPSLCAAVKLYPRGMTTNSDDGVDIYDNKAVFAVLELLEELDIPLCVHGESPGYVMDREDHFLNVLSDWLDYFGNLRVVLEHISTASAVRFLGRHPRLMATVTAHHLMLTLDDVVGGKLDPHAFCKPIPKSPDDRKTLLNLVLNSECPGHDRAMFGSDSAPHLRESKECASGCAGAFTAPIALQLLAGLFGPERQAALQEFVSDRAMAFYRVQLPWQKTVTLTKVPFVVPPSYSGVVPLFAGQPLAWSVSDTRVA